VLFGTAIPAQFEACAERRYFTQVHYLALVCDDDTLTTRLRSRPAWRQSGDAPFLDRMVAFNQWLKTHADQTDPPMTLLDTTHHTIEASAAHVTEWIRACLAPPRQQ
jgi:hypothetical protein